MAVIKPGPMISDIRGSINGVTFGRNRAGLFARQRVAPVQPGTEKQTNVRNAVSYLQNLWRVTLTNEERATWENLGTISGGIGALGDKIRLTGIQCFLRTNVIKRIAGHTVIITAPPVPYEISCPVLVFYSRVTAGVSLESIAPGMVEGDTLQLQISPVFSPTRNFYKGPYDHTWWRKHNGEYPFTLSTGQPYTLGDRHFITARYVDLLGRVSVINRFVKDVVADPG